MSALADRLNPVLADFWTAPDAPDGTPVRNRVLEGGRASSKTHDAGGFAIFLAQHCKIKFVCARQFQSKIEESVYALLKQKIWDFGLQAQFKITDNKITHRRTGSEFIFYGLWRSIDEVKGLEGIDIMWIEEAHNLTKEQWDVLNPTLRKEGSQFWIIFNPSLATDFVWQRFVVNPPAGTIHRKINYNENPFLPQTMLRVIKDAEQEDYDEYAHIYLGVPRDDDESVVIKRSWIMAAIDLHKRLEIEPTGSRRIGFDIADGGADKCATIGTHGSLAQSADLWKGQEDELLKSCTRVHQAAESSDSMIIWDNIGVGAAAGAKFNELGRGVRHKGFNAGGKVHKPEARYMNYRKNEDMFANLKAQSWWSVADRFRNCYIAEQERKEGKRCRFDQEDLIFIDSLLPHLEMLITELSTPKRDFDKTGKVMVESKRELKKRDVPSPNLADAFIMAYAPGMSEMIINPVLLTGRSKVA